ncbi:MAG: threonine dehydratase [Hyphomicrobiales bacterium]
MLFSQSQFEIAQDIVYQSIVPTPQYAWPLLNKRLGGDVWVKHENHTPTGAFKIRGGLVHLGLLKARGHSGGVISATRGNHGQSLAVAGAKEGLPVTIVAPENNSTEKNAAMRAQGAELLLVGKDFDESADYAYKLAQERGLHMVPSFHEELCLGVSTYGHELFSAVPYIHTVYVPIGLGSGICSLIAQRDLMGLKTEIVGVVPEKANAYALSYSAGEVVPVNSVETFADGTAVRVPNGDALNIITKGAARVITVSEEEIAEATRVYYTDTHNIAEGAGAVALAGRMRESDHMSGKITAVILSGGNIDQAWFSAILAGKTPAN